MTARKPSCPVLANGSLLQKTKALGNTSYFICGVSLGPAGEPVVLGPSRCVQASGSGLT